MPLESAPVAVVILHVIGEDHELGDVGEAFEFGVLKRSLMRLRSATMPSRLLGFSLR